MGKMKILHLTRKNGTRIAVVASSIVYYAEYLQKSKKDPNIKEKYTVMQVNVWGHDSAVFLRESYDEITKML